MVFLQEDAKLFLLDPELEKFQVFSENVKGLKNSPDNQKILYFNETQILVSSNQENHQDAAVINATNEPIKDCYWLNNEYIVISAGDSIMISEIDNRGGTNIVTMPNTLALLQGEPLTVKNPLILLRQQDKKLYIFSQKTVAVSERLLP